MNDRLAPTAAVLIIGNEILSGKTQDANLSFLGKQLSALGIRLLEARVIRDEPATIVAVLNELREQNSYVFTTGGIGPTHDDITAQAVADAFAVNLELNPEAVRRLSTSGREMNQARLKMAMIPAGATLIDNSLSLAPGFRIENVFVLAGIPRIAQVMFEAARDQLESAATILSSAITVDGSEGAIADPLGKIAAAHAELEIGSYPFSSAERFGTTLVVRGTDPAAVESAIDQIKAALQALELPFSDA
jgi:molybdenum cofactor synthesis domain-containing protein